MRSSQQQLIDLQNVVIKGLSNIRRRRLIQHACPIVLEGAEGVTIRDLLELIATGDKDIGHLNFASSVFFEKSPVFCEKEFPLPGEEWNAGYTAGKQEAKLNSGNIYWDGFMQGKWQGELEAKMKYEEECLIKRFRRLFRA